jgi:hypothetical protein
MKCVKTQVRDYAYVQVRNHACNRAGEQVSNLVWRQLWNQVRNYIGEQVSDQTYVGVCDRAEAQVKV